jgi:hypothetical protein
MKNQEDERKPCANEGCPRSAEKGEELCEVCALEWSLLHREKRPAGPSVPEEARLWEAGNR